MAAPARKAVALANNGYSGANTSSMTCTVPASVVTGDTGIFVMSQNTGTATFTAPAGWAPLADLADNSLNLRTRVFVKDLTTAEASTVTTWTTSVGGRIHGSMVVWTGTSANDIIAGAHPTPAMVSGAGGTSHTAPTSTTARTNSGIQQFWVIRSQTGGAPATITTPTGMTMDTATSSAYAAAPTFRIQPAYRTTSGAGSYGGQSVTSSATSTSTVYTIEVREAAAPVPVSAFNASPLSGDAPLNVAFTDTSTNTPTSWAWTFGDGTSSTSQSPSHSYTSPGSYTVQMVASNASGTGGTASRTITVTEAPALGEGLHMFVLKSGVWTPITLNVLAP